MRGAGDALQGASELADAILPQTLSTSPQCRDNSIATFFRHKCRNSNIATGARIANAPLMNAYQAEEDVITQYPKGVAIDQIERSLPSAPNRRALQRWLNALMAQHRIRRECHGRAVKYWRIKPVDSAEQAMRQPVGYKRSCARYSAVRQSLGDPDPFRLQFRENIAEVVAHVVRQKMNKEQAVRHIQQVAHQMEALHRPRFIEVVETQLLHLHEGNMARYRLRPSEFRQWQEAWQ
ncbi:MAG: hypothetical protein KAY21_02870 [Limnohabitans sp.]|nr:hypothetical protein [Limnohabitans sp.]